MSEKRFKLKENLDDVLIEDMITQSQYSIYGIVDLLNEQQATINKQERRIMVLENLLTNMSVKWVDDDD